MSDAGIGIAILGAGRMGAAIAERAAEFDGLSLASVWSRDPASVASAYASGVVVSDDLADVVTGADVLIDFTLAGATEGIAAAAAAAQTPLVCGVSGLGEAERLALEAAAGEVAVVYDRNMSPGVTLLDDAVRRVAAALGPGFSVEIHETHHVHKKDAPSGTALKLGETIANVRADLGEAHYESERRGEVPGDHTVLFRSATETLSFGHSVTTRDVFALGALRAAAWVAGKPAGLYSMRDVLFGD